MSYTSHKLPRAIAYMSLIHICLLLTRMISFELNIMAQGELQNFMALTILTLLPILIYILNFGAIIRGMVRWDYTFKERLYLTLPFIDFFVLIVYFSWIVNKYYS